MGPSNEANQGVINPHELYTLSAFTRRLGIRQATVRAARRAGLRVYYVHKLAYIHGSDWIEYVLTHKDRQAGHSSSSPT